MKSQRLVALAVLFYACVGFSLKAQDAKVAHTFFLIGDAGEPYIIESTIGNVLKRKIDSVKNASVLFLGDNIYPKGLSPKGTPSFKTEERIIQTQVDWVNTLDVNTFFIPGNHDWQHWGRDGKSYVIRQQQWIDSLKHNRIKFFPKEACPGPEEITIDEQTVLVIIDTQWFLHQWDKPAEDSSCPAKTIEEVMVLLNDILQRNEGKRILVTGHHPIYTYGSHGGVHGWKDHIFPLTALNENYYFPMPVLGSLLPLYRKYFGHIQDVAHPTYKEFAQPLERILQRHPGVIYLAGHEHALQHIVKDSVHYIVSGAAVKTTLAKTKGYAKFTKDVTGFGVLELYSDGRYVLKFFQVDKDFPEGKLIYSTQWLLKEPKSKPSIADYRIEQKSMNVGASNQYNKRKFHRNLFGENYRKEWSTRIDVPVFDIGAVKGGLKILQNGGGQQTLSLRLEDSTGHEYVLRTVEKYPEQAVPEFLRKTFAQDVVQDQISASHPYGALIIPTLANAAGVYHTNPELFFVPDDPRLGQYQHLFANKLVLLEERPAGNWINASHFGHSEKIISTSKVLEKLQEDNDNLVDEKFVLRSRLFDMIIGDWDRHDDQWRWATISNGKKGDLYRPIPRDRDQAFFVNEGMLAKIWSRRWALPKFEGFDDKIHWAPGLSFNARYFDRTFLTRLSLNDWLEVAKELKNELTDEEINSAIKQWPHEIQELHGSGIADNIRARRDNIISAATELYQFLSKQVNVVGSDKRELFEVEWLSENQTKVSVYKITKDNERGKILYERTFNLKDTKEIHLYGLSGDDQFKISGTKQNNHQVRIIGGEGNDQLEGVSKSRRVKFYDTYSGSTIVSGLRVKDKRSDDPTVNHYDRKSFQYNRTAPLLYGAYNPDDGLFIGGGFINITHGFRKEPFKVRHIFLARVAPLTASYNFDYRLRATEVIGRWDFDLNVDVRSPNYVNNFFGFGNETVFDDDIEDKGFNVDESIDYYRYRFREVKIEPSLQRKFGERLRFQIGPSFQRIKMEENKTGEDRFIDTYASTLDYKLFNVAHTFVGAFGTIELDGRNDKLLTTRGMHFELRGRSMFEVDKGNSFTSVNGSLSFYHSFTPKGRLIFTSRFGGGLNTGEYDFYQAQVLDGRTELRGYRKTRFYGDSKIFANAEVRLRLLKIQTYLFPASIGVLGFYDVGRVWYKNEDGLDPSTISGKSTLWHRGAGGGLWFTPFNFTVLSGEVAHSKDGNMAYLRLGFLF